MNKFFLVIIFSLVMAFPMQAGVYKQEFEALKERKPIVFSDRDPFVNSSLVKIQKDIENYKELRFIQRLARFPMFAMDGYVVTAESMPKLYSYVETMCANQGIKMPTIFVSTKKGFFNAAAAKFFMSSGGIIVGHDLILDSSDQELEAIVAHEIGHIKHNHVNKILLVKVSATCVLLGLFTKFLKKNLTVVHHLALAQLSSLLTSLIIGKKFEKEADKFACHEMCKEEGLIEFFENLLKKEAQQDKDFDDTYILLKESKSSIEFSDYLGLHFNYYFAKSGHKLNKAYKWLYYHTPFGQHPSCQERIKSARRYKKQRSV